MKKKRKGVKKTARKKAVAPSKIPEPTISKKLETHRKHIDNLKKINKDKKILGPKCALALVAEQKARVKDDKQNA